MITDLSERDLVLITCIGILAFNALVALVCLIVGPRHWARRLCAITAGFSGLLLLLSAAWLIYAFAYIFLTTGWMPEHEFIFLVVFFPILPLLGEYLVLRAIYHWRLREPRLPNHVWTASWLFRHRPRANAVSNKPPNTTWGETRLDGAWIDEAIDDGGADRP